MQNEIKNSEKIAIYTKDKEKLLDISKIAYERHASKGFMCKKKDSRYNGKFIKPWIECVTCFVINKSNNKVLVEKRATGEINPEELDLVSGHVKSWELNRIAMIRELKEETGLDIKIIKPIYTFTAIRPDYQTVGIGFLTIPTNDHVQLSHEHTDYQFVSSDELPHYVDKKIYDDIIMTLKEYESMHIED